jgi:hypothetical protein
MTPSQIDEAFSSSERAYRDTFYIIAKSVGHLERARCDPNLLAILSALPEHAALHLDFGPTGRVSIHLFGCTPKELEPALYFAEEVFGPLKSSNRNGISYSSLETQDRSFYLSLSSSNCTRVQVGTTEPLPIYEYRCEDISESAPE